jgi:hypothetical protein
VKLDGQLAGLAIYVNSSADSAPTAAAEARDEALKQQLDAQLARWHAVVETDLPGFEKLTRDQNIQAVIIPGTLGTSETQPAEAK